MDTIKITFNDGTLHEYPKGTSYYEISKDYKAMKDIMGVKVNHEVFALDKKVMSDKEVEFIDAGDLIGNKIYRSGLKAIFDLALHNTYPNLEINYAHSVPSGMLGVITGEKILTQIDVSKIKEEMTKIIDENIRFEKINVQAREAIKYYEQAGEKEKVKNIQYINDKVVVLYKLKNRINYYYTEMPYSTGSISKFELIYLGNNRIVFIYPNIGNGDVVPEYVHYDNIINCFALNKEWLNKLKMPYVTNINKCISDGEIHDFIKANELVFNLNVARIAKTIMDNSNIKFVLIAGPSSAGKTTTAYKLSTYLQAIGYNPIKISLDDYFKNLEDTPKDEFGNYDFECLEAIDLELFNSDLKKLLNNEKITLPQYNFITGKRELTKTKVALKENGILIIEGLHAINEELTPHIEAKNKYKIYLSPFMSLNIDRHNYISTIDLRLLRRIVRDNRTRGYKITDTIKNWQKVRQGEEEHIFPFIHQADLIINTAYAYEVNAFLKQFFVIPSEYIPDDSILREFIGGKNND